MIRHGSMPISMRMTREADASGRPDAASSRSREPSARLDHRAALASGGGEARPSGQANGPKGFRNFMSAYRRHQGPATDQNGAAERELRIRMSRLGHLFNIVDFWSSKATVARDNTYDDLKPWENPDVPSGYTYLLQLVAHDLVSTSFPISILEETSTGVSNTRSSALWLDTLYGSGPAGCPLAFASHHNEFTRTKLRVGVMKDRPGRPEDMRDIPRIAVSGPLLTEVAVADPRNDSNPIVAQMTVLFSMLHNTIIELLAATEEDKESRERDERAVVDSSAETEMKRFFCARAAVTLIYRNIIRKDLLERILHPTVYAAYNVAGFFGGRGPAVDFLDQNADADARMPLEFSHAVFRFGHAMIRPSYRFNERDGAEFSLDSVLRQNSSTRAVNMPLDEKWIVRWSYFFKLNHRRPNLSKRIGPMFNRDLSSSDVFSVVDEVEDEKGKPLGFGLAYRDLLGAAFLDLPSAQELIGIIEQQRPELFGQSKPLSSRDYSCKLSEFLTSTAASGLDEGDVKELLRRTPLGLFVLLEAAVDPETQGLRLGLLGSIIVAEVILAAMKRDPVPDEIGAASLDQALDRLCQRTYPSGTLAAVANIDTMADLIRFVAARNGLEHESAGFI